MGMSASQARFLGLTARQINLEYEGQQINQQRTSLAQQSANLYNQMLGINVPTPPAKNSAEFTKTVYSFMDTDGNAATIDSIVTNTDPATNGNSPYIVRLTKDTSERKAFSTNLNTMQAMIRQQERDDGGVDYYFSTKGAAGFKLTRVEDKDYQTDSKALLAQSIDVQTSDGQAAAAKMYKYNAGTASNPDWRYVSIDDDDVNDVITLGTTYNDAGEEAEEQLSAGAVTRRANGNYQVVLNAETETATKRKIQLIPVDYVDDEANSLVDSSNLAQIESSYVRTQAEEGDNLHWYKYTNAQGLTTYIQLQENAETLEPDPGYFNNELSLDEKYTYYIDNQESSFSTDEYANITRDNSGRISGITIGENTFAVKVNQVTDEAAYEDAMEKYKYQMAEYDKAMEDISARSEAIQAQDRTLELRLKQLDTEQKAVTAEMDAVKKVIEKNVESTFKTFG